MNSKPTIIFNVPDRMIKLWELMPDIEVMVNSIRWRWERPRAPRVWVDSGGYQAMVKGVTINLNAVTHRYIRIEADLYISLDLPPIKPCEASADLVKRNVNNFIELSSRLSDKTIVPVIHCYPSDLMFEAIDIYKSYGANLIAFGGFASPSMAKGGDGSRTLPMVALALLTKSFKGHVHVLGVGGAPVAYSAMKLLGVSSVDTSSWRTKAAYGKVIVPGRGERYVGNGRAKFGRKDFSENDYEVLVSALERSRFPSLNSLDFMLKTFKGRALINAWIMKHYPDLLEPENGFMWLVKLADTLAKLQRQELALLLDEKLRHLKGGHAGRPSPAQYSQI